MTMTPAIDNAALARRFLPSRWSPDRYHYYYARSKLATDPVYGGVLQAQDGCDAPLLALGCGIGLLAHYLRAAGRSMPYVGVDVDAGKIAVAERGLRNQPLEDVRFAVRDVGRDAFEHHGSVAILDVLQYLSADAQTQLLTTVAAMLTPGARLVIRSGLRDDSARSRFTRFADWFARASGWMETRPDHFPTREQFETILTGLGLATDIRPFRGNTPFNNWLIVARR